MTRAPLDSFRDGPRAGAAGLALAALALPLFVAACAREPARRVPAAAPAARPVAVATVDAAPAGATLLPGTVYARDRATLTARTAAAVAALPFREGEAVTRGAVVVRLDDDATRAAVQAAEVARDAADADARRTRALAAARAATPRELDAAEARLAAARAAAQAARENLAYAALRAPFAGTLAARRVEVGDVVQPGQALVEVEGGGFEARAAVPAALAGGLAPGRRLVCRVEGVPAPVAAEVRAISAAADPRNQRVELRADLALAPGLRSGAFARLEVPDPAAEPALRVPTAALFSRGGLTGLFVVRDGRAELRWVATGAVGAGWTEIRAGVRTGERVVVEPGDLVDQQPVEALP